MPNQNGNHALDGSSFLNVITQKKDMPERTVFWKTPEAKAARKGNWKIIQDEINPEGALYNLKSDLSESKNLKLENSEVYQSLSQAMRKWENEIVVSNLKATSEQ